VLIPKGTAVAFSLYTLHRRPDLYGMDAECFRPERWDEDLPLFRDHTTRNYGYLPFSGGPRVCLGSKYLLLSTTWVQVTAKRYRSGFRLDRGCIYHRSNS
jgi:cytochrome P450